MSALADDRGAILVLGVFLAAFMAGVLFHTVSVAEAILLRERLQDAADAGAFSAAVTAARGMNVIVLVNLVMAALLAVLVALRVVELLATAAIAILSAFSWTGAAAAIPPLVQVRETATTTRQQLREPIYSALRALRVTARGVRAAVPLASQGSVLDVVGEYAPAASFGFAVPSRLTLPTEDDDFGVLCDHAGELAAELALRPIDSVLPDAVRDEVVDAAGAATRAASSYFCGKKGGAPPEMEQRVRHVLPELPERQACVEAARGRRADADGACSRADAAEARFAMSARGECARDCGRGGAYETRAALAREQCDPGRGRRMTGYVWQSQEREVTLERVGEAWVEVARRALRSPRLVEQAEASRLHPCGSDAALHAESWTRELLAPSGDPLPVCREVLDELERSEARVRLRVVDVLQVLGCSYVTTETIAMGDDFAEDRRRRERAAADETLSPQRVEAGLELGDEDFLVRVVAVAPARDPLGEGARVAAWGHPVSAALPVALPRLALAQAEYFFDGRVSRVEWMWRMDWRARLVRVRWPESGQGGADRSAPSLAAACGARGGSGRDGVCGPASAALERAVGWMVH